MGRFQEKSKLKARFACAAAARCSHPDVWSRRRHTLGGAKELQKGVNQFPAFSAAWCDCSETYFPSTFCSMRLFRNRLRLFAVHVQISETSELKTRFACATAVGCSHLDVIESKDTAKELQRGHSVVQNCSKRANLFPALTARCDCSETDCARCDFGHTIVCSRMRTRMCTELRVFDAPHARFFFTHTSSWVCTSVSPNSSLCTSFPPSMKPASRRLILHLTLRSSSCDAPRVCTFE